MFGFGRDNETERNFEKKFMTEMAKKLPKMRAKIEVESAAGVTRLMHIEGDRTSVEASVLDLIEKVANAKGVTTLEYLAEMKSIVEMRNAIVNKNENDFDEALQSIINQMFGGK